MCEGEPSIVHPRRAVREKHCKLQQYRARQTLQRPLHCALGRGRKRSKFWTARRLSIRRWPRPRTRIGLRWSMRRRWRGRATRRPIWPWRGHGLARASRLGGAEGRKNRLGGEGRCPP